jgi:poly-gamma-glutamate synthesis protein (capsule biosynthesis protein)
MADFGKEGYNQSISLLEAGGLDWFGDAWNNDPGPKIVDVRGQKVAFIGYHQFFDTNTDSVIIAIAKAKAQEAFTVIYPHWGEEYNIGITEFQRQTAHAFIDAGADLVLGAHPHVIEPVEIYKDKAIFYSLGNFIFDQDFSAETKQGLAVQIVLNKKDVVYTLYPFNIEDSQAIFMDATSSKKVVGDLANRSYVSEEVRADIGNKGVFRLEFGIVIP